MSASITFPSNDALLKRKRCSKNGTRTRPVQILSSSHTGGRLDIIPEEGNMNVYPKATPRAQRRHALDVAQLRLSNITEDSESSEDTDFNVTFTNVSYNFPLVPTSSHTSVSSTPKSFPVSPLSPCSSVPSSPDSQFAGLPSTPSSSDNEFTSLPLPSPGFRFNPRRAAIKPLVINKTHRPATLPMLDQSEASDSDESDSEYYNKEFSKFLSVDSRRPSTFFPAHRDSIFVVPTYSPPASPTRKRRNSSLPRLSLVDAPPVPPIPSQYLSLPKCSKTLSNAGSRRPPPKMSIPDDACSVFSLSLYMYDEMDIAAPSPPSIYSQDSASMQDSFDDEDVNFPADFEVQVDCPMMLPLSLPGSPIDLEADIAHGLEQLWASSTPDGVSPCTIPREKEMVEAERIQVEEEGLGVGFILEDEVDDPKTVKSQIVIASPPPSPSSLPPPMKLTLTIPTTPPRRPHRNIDSPPISFVSSFSFPPSLIPFKEEELQSAATTQEERDDFDERKHGLKSKWSSSTLASVREEHSAITSPTAKFLGASRLKQYFQSGSHKRNTSNSVMSPNTIITTPLSTPTPVSPRFSRTPVSPFVSPIKSQSPKGKDKKEKPREKKSKRDSSDVMVIGYHQTPIRDYYPSSPIPTPYTPTSTPPPRNRTGSPFKRFNDAILSTSAPSPPPSPIKRHGFGNAFGLKRSPSQCSMSALSDCGGDTVGMNEASAFDLNQGPGLRRKPIPVEMFLRNGA